MIVVHGKQPACAAVLTGRAPRGEISHPVDGKQDPFACLSNVVSWLPSDVRSGPQSGGVASTLDAGWPFDPEAAVRNISSSIKPHVAAMARTLKPCVAHYQPIAEVVHALTERHAGAGGEIFSALIAMQFTALLGLPFSSDKKTAWTTLLVAGFNLPCNAHGKVRVLELIARELCKTLAAEERKQIFRQLIIRASSLDLGANNEVFVSDVVNRAVKGMRKVEDGAQRVAAFECLYDVIRSIEPVHLVLSMRLLIQATSEYVPGKLKTLLDLVLGAEIGLTYSERVSILGSVDLYKRYENFDASRMEEMLVTWLTAMEALVIGLPENLTDSDRLEIALTVLRNIALVNRWDVYPLLSAVLSLFPRTMPADVFQTWKDALADAPAESSDDVVKLLAFAGRIRPGGVWVDARQIGFWYNAARRSGLLKTSEQAGAFRFVLAAVNDARCPATFDERWLVLRKLWRVAGKLPLHLRGGATAALKQTLFERRLHSTPQEAARLRFETWDDLPQSEVQEATYSPTIEAWRAQYDGFFR